MESDDEPSPSPNLTLPARPSSDPWLEEYCIFPRLETQAQSYSVKRISQFRKSVQKRDGRHKSLRDIDDLMSYESYDFQICENALLRKQQLHLTKHEKYKKNIIKWSALLVIGAIVGIAAFVLHLIIDGLSTLRWGVAHDILNDVGPEYAWMYFTALSIIYVGVASYFTSYHAPSSAGSGIPEVKSILNGVNLKDVLAFKTCLVNFFGVSLAVSGGLCVGLEGPLVQTGSAVALQVNQLSGRHRWDHNKKEFIASGTSAGIATAFASPIPAVLFVMEEMTSFWNTPFLWIVIFGSFCANVFYSLTRAVINGHPEYLHADDLVRFGQVDEASYQTWELATFAFVGILGGVSGGLFNKMNYEITKKRKKYWWDRPILRVLQAVGIAILTWTLFFWLPLAFDQCESDSGFDGDVTNLVQFTCSDGEHNRMATLTFQPLEQAVFNLFHYDDPFGFDILSVYWVLLYFCSVITYGLSIPAGLINPATFTGAAMGRFIGEFLNLYVDSSVSPGMYALAGAAAFLGSVTRLTLSIAVLMLSVVNNYDYILPMLLCTLIAKETGGLFGISCYDVHIDLKNIPFVEDKPHKQLLYLAAEDVMVKPVICFAEVENVQTILQVIKACSHNGFPIINSSRELVGLILRHQLLILLKNKAFVEFPETELTGADFMPNISSTCMEITDLNYGEDENLSHYTINLKPYMNESCVSIRKAFPMTAVYRTFRQMSLRHLMVRSHNNKVVGIITRKELMTDFADDLS